MHRTGSALVLSLVLLAAPAGPGASAAPERGQRCAGLVPTVVGTPGPDELTGTDGPDVVLALGGDDFVETGRGHDVVCAGDGFDHVRTGRGRDRVLGGPGDDMVGLGPGLDLALGQGGIDSLFGGAGDDELRGGRGTSFVVEALVGGAGDDLLRGGPGLDTAQYFDSPRGVRIDLRRGRSTGRGTDTLIGIEGAVGSNHDDVIIGDPGGNGLFGQEGDDLIRGEGSGTVADGTADFLSGDSGDDDLRGGQGEDLALFASIPTAVDVDLGAGTATGQGSDTLTGIEGVQGSLLADTLTGGPADDLLVGSAGDDVLDGGGGSDTAVYADVVGPVDVDLRAGTAAGRGADDDSLTGIENLWGTRGDDVLRGDDADNRIAAGAGDDLLVGYAGVDLLDGGPGKDRCDDDPAELESCEGAPRTTAPPVGPTASWLRWSPSGDDISALG